MEMKCRLVEVAGASNVRDIGGYPADGGEVVYGRFYRAGAMNGLTRPGVEQVRKLGIRLIVDLRSRAEARSQPDTLQDDGEIGYLHLPLLDYVNSNITTGDLTGFPASMAEVYIGLLDRDGESFCRLLRAFAAERGPVLYHCTAGKDRTGVSTMLLLSLAGVSREDIVEDYSYSQHILGTTAYEPLVNNLPAYLFESRAETMEAALDHLHRRYGGIAGYLDHIGLSREEAAILKNRLLGA